MKVKSLKFKEGVNISRCSSDRLFTLHFQLYTNSGFTPTPNSDQPFLFNDTILGSDNLTNNAKTKLDLVRGFTLIETIVAIFVFAILMIGVSALTSGIFVGSQKQAGVLESTDRARKAAFAIINELRNAQTGNNGAYALAVAGNNEIVFFSNPDRDASIERVRYYLQNNSLYKGVVQYNGTNYPTSTEVSALVEKNITNGAAPVFYYYDGSFVGSSTQASLSQPVNVTDVKYVRVNLRVQNTAGVTGNNSFSITAGGSIRNLKTNLGE